MKTLTNDDLIAQLIAVVSQPSSHISIAEAIRDAYALGVAQGVVDGGQRMKDMFDSALHHERNTTGVDRRHWSETEVAGSEDLS